MVKQPSLPHRFGAGAVVAEAVRVSRRARRERRPALGRLELAVGLPLMVLAAVIALAIPVCTFLYAAFGTAVPFLVNARGPAKGPAPLGERLTAATLCVLTTAALLFLCWYVLKGRLARPMLAVDEAGVWLGRVARGRQVDDGLFWADITAVNVVPAGGRTTVPAGNAAPPLVEVFTVQPVRESGTLLSLRVVNAPPPTRGVRGKRYVIVLVADRVDPAAVAAAVDRFAPGRRIAAVPNSQ